MSMIRNVQSGINGLLNACFLLLFFISSSQAGNDSLTSVTIPRFSTSINIDGFLNEPIWKEAAIIKNFYTYRPVDGQPAMEQTAALLGYNQFSLFIAFICFDPSPELIRSSISKRDDIDEDDVIVLYLDTSKRIYE